MSTELVQSVYRGGTTRVGESVALWLSRAESDRFAAVIVRSVPAIDTRQLLYQEHLGRNESDARSSLVAPSKAAGAWDMYATQLVLGGAVVGVDRGAIHLARPPRGVGYRITKRGCKVSEYSLPATARENSRPESQSLYVGFSGGGSHVFRAYAKDVPEQSPTPSKCIDAQYRSMLETFISLSGENWGISGKTTQAVAVDHEAAWNELNERRLSLIDKDIDHGLSMAEKAELDSLERKAEDYMNKVAPLPFEVIDKLKACAAKDGLNVSLE